MIHDEITDVLLRARIPASTKGFIYIHDALEINIKIPTIFPVRSAPCTQRLPNSTERASHRWNAQYGMRLRVL